PLKRWEKEVSANKNIFFNRLIWEKIPFITLTIISGIITFWVQYEANAVYPSFPMRIFNSTVAYAVYLGKTFWPADLALNYFFAYSFDTWQITASFIVLTLITIAVIYYIRSRPFLFVGWFWYLGTLVPVIGLVPTSALLADHYTYLPSIGIAVMLAWGIGSLLKRAESRRKILAPVSVLVLAIIMILTWQQCGYWKNGVELWNHALKTTKESFHPYLRLGHAYGIQGDNRHAIYNFDKAISLKPNEHGAYNGRGIVYFQLGQYQMAMQNFNKAIQLKPDYASAYNNRAIIYINRGNAELGCEDARKACSLEVCAALDEAKLKGYCR
ncbi:MAG: tetratricopeptide repeat protein, partial [Syntrophaceae bacterium]|nr:tetratricopeptide repeat protein [Syntrophaceae bacterium]